MKSFLIITFAGLLISQSQSVVSAQPPLQGGERGQGQIRGQRPLERGGRRGRIDPLMRILDSDGDHQLSKEEITAAPSALKKLDRNSDGELTFNELRPPINGQGNGTRSNGGQGQNRSAKQQSGQAGQRSGQAGRRFSEGERGADGGRDPARSDARFASELMDLDSNLDGVISSNELPEHMQEAFKIADADQSGSLNQSELLVLAAQFRRNTLSPEGEHAEMKNRPTGGNQNRGR